MIELLNVVNNIDIMIIRKDLKINILSYDHMCMIADFRKEQYLPEIDDFTCLAIDSNEFWSTYVSQMPL